ncbi:F-box only protein 7-like [Saccostrea echinata]|uniref:F-box only protein 7-like n=1 Tax=Saccostrea echinata TaxID=191078 RepID=UPI002A83C8F5|nr:F-box only protein 7-like [Saccostrea echinata]
MKFRVKYKDVSRNVSVEERDESSTTLCRLEAAVSEAFSGILKRSFYLSLNKKDRLGEGNQTLTDLGLVSGDLLHVVSDDPEEVKEQKQPSNQRSTNRPLGLTDTQVQSTSSSHRNDHPSTSRQSAVQNQNPYNQPSCSTDDSQMEAENFQSEAVFPLDPVVVSQCLSEPRLCSECIQGSLPPLLSELYSDLHCQSCEEALCLVLHVLMLEAGYQPISSTLNSNPRTQITSDTGCNPQTRLESDVCPTDSWRERAPAFYKLEYTHPTSGSTVYTVTAVPMGTSLIVHGQVKIEENIEKCQCQLKTKDFVQNVTPEPNTCYQNLPKLSRTFKDSISLPLLQKYREAMNLVPLHGLLALSNELKLKILGCLDVVSLLRMSEVCKEFRSLSNDKYIWRRLFLSHFGNRAHNDLNQNWKELYKAEYRNRKQQRKWWSQMTTIVPPFIPADPYSQRIPPLAPFSPGMIGGDYDLYPQFHGIPNPIFGRRGGHVPEMRPRFDPFGPGQNFPPGPGGGFYDRGSGGSRFSRGSRSGMGGFGGGPKFF